MKILQNGSKLHFIAVTISICMNFLNVHQVADDEWSTKTH